MKVERLITTTEPVDLDITEVTLLSKEEFEAAQDIIPAVDRWWWLRSPDIRQSYAAYVSPGGSLYYNFVLYYSYVRPALRIENLKSSNLESGDKVRIANKTWTVISSELMLCDGFIGQSAFRKDIDADDANVYEASDVKMFVDLWAKQNRLVKEKQPDMVKVVRCKNCGEFWQDGYCDRHHFNVRSKMKKEKSTDFTIVSKPDYIKLECPYCRNDIKIKWVEVDAPKCWQDDWGYVECPECQSEIKLDDWDYD